jgi:hypothetical protein
MWRSELCSGASLRQLPFQIWAISESQHWCMVVNLQVDKHIDSLYLSFQGSKDVGLAKRLANRGLQPTKVSLGVGPRKRLAKGAAAIRAGSNALTAMLVSEQHCQLLKRATDISFGTDCTLHKKALHVSDLWQVTRFHQCWLYE